MKRFLILLSLLFCNVVFADTINLHWLNEDGSIYQNSTCVIDSDLILPATPPTKYGYTFTGWKMSTFTPIEYLESTGTQWINTTFSPYNIGDSRFVVTCQFSSGQDSNWLGNGISSRGGTGFYTAITDASRGSKFVYYDGADNITTISTPTRYGKYTYDYNGSSGYFKVKQNETELVNVSVNHTTTSTKPNIILFGFNNANDNGTPRIVNQKIYNAKIYYNNELLHDFIPVLDYTSIPCMYDKVTEQFFYNQGTGQFVAGPALQ